MVLSWEGENGKIESERMRFDGVQVKTVDGWVVGKVEGRG